MASERTLAQEIQRQQMVAELRQREAQQEKSKLRLLELENERRNIEATMLTVDTAMAELRTQLEKE